MAMYNVSMVANSTGMLQFFQRTNDYLLDGWFGLMILISFFFIIFFSVMVRWNSAPKGAAVACWTCFAISFMMSGLGLVTPLAPLVLAIASAGAAAALFYE